MCGDGDHSVTLSSRHEVKIMFSVTATHFQIHFVVKFIPGSRRSSFMVLSNVNGILTYRTGFSSAETSAYKELGLVMVNES